jgi:selenium metabolism protein YedF
MKEAINIQNFAIAIQRDYLGDGDQVLGKMLIKSFLDKLTDNASLPKTIVFLNSGIFLALKDSPVLDSLKVFEEVGVELLCCGTCIDFFKKREDVSVGKISNMVEIVDRLTSSEKVLYP